MRVSSFFAGIGGFDLGFERAGMHVVFQCESVARNLTWTEWEMLMGFPEGWTVVEGDSLVMPLSQSSVSGLEDEY